VAVKSYFEGKSQEHRLPLVKSKHQDESQTELQHLTPEMFVLGAF
jgi:hypothetical protein